MERRYVSSSRGRVVADYLGFEPLTIPRGAFDPLSMSTGEPSPPKRVIWKGQEYPVGTVERTGVSTSPDRGGSGERYRDRHSFLLVLTDGPTLEVYFERRPRDRSRRWWARATETPVSGSPGEGTAMSGEGTATPGEGTAARSESTAARSEGAVTPGSRPGTPQEGPS